jgi:Zn-dependent metalloprotease
MKKQLLATAIFFLFCVQAFTQNFLKEIIRGPKGVSKHFVTLDEKNQVAFDPAKARDVFGLDAKSDLVLMNVTYDQIGQAHYRYYQTYQSIPIENTMYIAHTVNKKLLGMSGEIVTDFNVDMPQRTLAKISVQNAVSAAIQYVSAKKYMWQDAGMEQRLKDQSANTKASYAPVAKLVWYNAGDQVNSTDLRLAFKVDVYAKEPLGRADYFVDAETGKVIGKKDKLYYTDATGTANTQYSGSKTIHSDKNGTQYRLWDLTRGNGVITLHGDLSSNLDYTSATANWNLTGQNQHAMDVHYGVEQTYDYYKTTFNRSSVDNNGLALISYVNVTGLQDNAYWDGTSMNYGIRSTNSKGVTAIDVTGHELTHGVTQYTSALNYSYESGAMNESMSDIMGKSVQFFAKPTDINWQISNDMGWVIRDMSNPNLESQPDTYEGTDWQYTSDDNGGVHTNSGVGNYMFYLLVNGGTGTNDYGDSYAVTGIGLAKADQIIYRTETVYLTPTSQYNDWREACIAAATDLFGANSAPLKQVKNAWHAVGVGDYYCYSGGYSTLYFFIKKITFSNISNTSGDNGGYANYTGLTANITKGQTYPITFTASYPTGTVYNIHWNVYVDFNHDGDFIDANETVATINSGTKSAFTRYITIPSNALTGKTVMRVQMSDVDDIGNGPCYLTSYGETEDYSVNISAPLISSASQAPLIALTENNPGIFISPNPVISGINAMLHYTTTKQGNITMKAIDIYGRTVQTAEIGLQNAGSHTYAINFAGKLASGSYYVTVEQDNNVLGKTKTMITKAK